MTAIRKFLFDTSFDIYRPAAPVEVEEEPELPEPEEPSFSEAELDAARREAFEAGQSEGRNQALQGIEQGLATSLQGAQQQLDALFAQLQADKEIRRAESMDLALEALGSLFPCLQKNYGFAEIEAAIAESLQRLESEPRVVIRVADQIIDPLRERLGDLAERSAFEGKLVLVPDSALDQGAVRVEWASGGAELDSAQVWQELQSLIDERASVLKQGRGEAPASDEGPSPDPVDQAPAEI